MEHITVTVRIQAPLEKVWSAYTDPAHITQWAFASDDWYAPRAEQDLRAGGQFLTRMEARDGSVGFDFTGVYTDIIPLEKIAYTMDGDDARKAVITFESDGDMTSISVTFDPEQENPREMQQAGWQAILDNFKKHVESNEG